MQHEILRPPSAVSVSPKTREIESTSPRFVVSRVWTVALKNLSLSFPPLTIPFPCFRLSPLPLEALTLYDGGIELLLQASKKEPGEQRKQTLVREASVHLSRAEDIKLALGPPQPPSPPRTGTATGAGTAAAATATGRGKGKGKSALSRPAPTAADVRGNLRVRQTQREKRGVRGGGGVYRGSSSIPKSLVFEMR